VPVDDAAAITRCHSDDKDNNKEADEITATAAHLFFRFFS